MGDHVAICRYEIHDRAGCLQVFASNTPRFFAYSERAAFAVFLDVLPGPFWVARFPESSIVIGCGGVSLADDGTVAWLRWGMVHAAHHRQSVGTQLLQARLAWIQRQQTITRVRVATTAPVRGFFERMGFAVVAVTADGFGTGMTRYDLERLIRAGDMSSNRSTD